MQACLGCTFTIQYSPPDDVVLQPPFPPNQNLQNPLILRPDIQMQKKKKRKRKGATTGVGGGPKQDKKIFIQERRGWFGDEGFKLSLQLLLLLLLLLF